MSLWGKKWIIQNKDSGADLMDKLLLNRQIDTDEKRRDFFEGDLNLVHDPFLMTDMQKAVERIKRAIEEGEKIMVFGDYDIDGVTGTALLYDFLKRAGAETAYLLPHREKDGYGLKDYFIRRFKDEGVRLIVTVDCGTSNAAEIQLANTLGMDVIVTDHHSMPAELPQAYAIINPKRKDCHYPNPNICGSTIAYKLVMALSRDFMKEQERKEYLMKQLSIVTLGVIGDCMPLSGENRVLVKYGLKSLQAGHNPGMSALVESVGVAPSKITSFTIGFQVGPRLNAAGRLDKADHAFELILGNLEKAEVLNQLNLMRRTLVKDYLDEVMAELDARESLPNLIALHNPEWKAGLLGLIASKIAETYHRPTIVMQDRDDELVASCRSVGNFDITGFLREIIEDLCTSFGGHAMAGGFTLPTKNLKEFSRRLAEASQKSPELGHPEGILEIDCEVTSKELTLECARDLSRLQPYGTGNPEPTLVIRNAKILNVRPVGQQGEHLQFPVEYEGQVHSAIAFRFGEHF
ncbi:MAG: single-stranded-DNA-specific exonuclease RecJ, partial [Candidatus Peregrinibacteria bacterium]